MLDVLCKGVLASAVSFVGVDAGSDLGVWEDFGELLDDTEGVRLALRIEAPISSALKCWSGSKLEPLSFSAEDTTSEDTSSKPISCLLSTRTSA